jgi:hypothetical protein
VAEIPRLIGSYQLSASPTPDCACRHQWSQDCSALAVLISVAGIGHHVTVLLLLADALTLWVLVLGAMTVEVLEPLTVAPVLGVSIPTVMGMTRGPAVTQTPAAGSEAVAAIGSGVSSAPMVMLAPGSATVAGMADGPAVTPTPGRGSAVVAAVVLGPAAVLTPG